jgi:hypothetical protein
MKLRKSPADCSKVEIDEQENEKKEHADYQGLEQLNSYILTDVAYLCNQRYNELQDFLTLEHMLSLLTCSHRFDQRNTHN